MSAGERSSTIAASDCWRVEQHNKCVPLKGSPRTRADSDPRRPGAVFTKHRPRATPRSKLYVPSRRPRPVASTFYRVVVRTDKNHLGTDEHQLPIIPGMVTTVEVLTGAKSVLDYMIRPARLLRDEALRER